MNGKEGRMPAFGGSIDADQLADLIAYILVAEGLIRPMKSGNLCTPTRCRSRTARQKRSICRHAKVRVMGSSMAFMTFSKRGLTISAFGFEDEMFAGARRRGDRRRGGSGADTAFLEASGDSPQTDAKLPERCG
jgi:hypothetical protein